MTYTVLGQPYRRSNNAIGVFAVASILLLPSSFELEPRARLTSTRKRPRFNSSEPLVPPRGHPVEAQLECSQNTTSADQIGWLPGRARQLPDAADRCRGDLRQPKYRAEYTLPPGSPRAPQPLHVCYTGLLQAGQRHTLRGGMQRTRPVIVSSILTGPPGAVWVRPHLCAPTSEGPPHINAAKLSCLRLYDRPAPSYISVLQLVENLRRPPDGHLFGCCAGRVFNTSSCRRAMRLLCR